MARTEEISKGVLVVQEEKSEFFDLPNNSVNTENIVDEAVTTQKIEDGAVTSEKLAPGVEGAHYWPELLDTPNSYSGQANNVVRVNGSADGLEFIDPVTFLNYKLKVSSNDTTDDFLLQKLVPGTNITIVENNDGGNETLTINATAIYEYTDDVFRISDEVDNTKKIAFEASGVAASTTRTITMPDSNVDLGDIGLNTTAIGTKQDTLSGVNAIDINQTTDIVSLVLDPVDPYVQQSPTGLKAKVSASYAAAAAGELLDAVAIKTEVDLKANATDLNNYILLTEKAAINGVATLDGSGKVPVGQLLVSASYAAAAAGELMDAADIKTEVDLKANATDLNNYILLTEKAANNGVATLDAGGKVPANQLSISAMEYKGSWAASTNTPTLANGIGNQGDVYVASDAGAVDFGAGLISFTAGDWVMYNGTIWEKSHNSSAVASVNSQTGVVVLDTGDISENGNLYFTDARVLASVLTGFAAGADTAILATDTVLQGLEKTQGQINSRMSSLSDDTTPALGGDLTLGANQLLHNSDGIQKGQTAGNTYFDDYDHALTLSATTTAVIAALTVAHATYDAQKIDYKIASATHARVGSLFIATNGTDVSITDTNSETSDMQISFSAAINGSNIEISYDNSSTSTATMRAQTRRFKA